MRRHDRLPGHRDRAIRGPRCGFFLGKNTSRYHNGREAHSPREVQTHVVFRGRRRSCGAERRRANLATQSSVVCAMRGTKNPWQCPLMPASSPAEWRLPSVGVARPQSFKFVGGRRSGGSVLRRQESLHPRSPQRLKLYDSNAPIAAMWAACKRPQSRGPARAHPSPSTSATRLIMAEITARDR